MCEIARVAREIKWVLTWLLRTVSDSHDPARYDKRLCAHTRDGSVITRRRKSEEDEGMHAYTRGMGWRGRVNAVRLCHVATTYALCETSSPRRRSRNGQTEEGRQKQRESSRIGICTIPIVSTRNQTCHQWVSSIGDAETFYQI